MSIIYVNFLNQEHINFLMNELNLKIDFILPEGDGIEIHVSGDVQDPATLFYDKFKEDFEDYLDF